MATPTDNRPGRGTSNQDKQTRLYEEDHWGRIVFRLLLILIPVGTAVSETWLTIGYPIWKKGQSSSPVLQTVTELRPSLTPGVNITTTTTFPISTTGTLGAFDPALDSAGNVNLFVIGLIIFLVAGIIETSLLLVYGAFYVNDPVNDRQALGLPPGSVRIFLLIIIVFVTVFFALLPNSWGDNKAVVFLFGILSTVVGFYFGSRRDEEGEQAPTIKMSLVSKEVSPGKFTLDCRLSPGFDATFLGRPPEILVYLIAADGSIIPNSERVGVLDSSGLVSFDYNDLQLATPPRSTSFIVRVRRPKNIICDDRLTYNLAAPSPASTPTGQPPATANQS